MFQSGIELPCPPRAQAMKAAGVTEVVLAINYQPEVRAIVTCEWQPHKVGLSRNQNAGPEHSSKIARKHTHWEEMLACSPVQLLCLTRCYGVDVLPYSSCVNGCFWVAAWHDRPHPVL
jgi:hypothetical protein